jgi:phage head maturation protease
MVDATLDILRRDAVSRRTKRMPGGNRIEWSVKDAVEIRDYGMEMSWETIRAATAERKLLDFDRAALMRSVAQSGIEVKGEMQATDFDFLVCASAEVCDLSNDLVKQKGIDDSIYKTNPVVPPFHDTTVVPVAASGPIWRSGDATLAVFRFPQSGISDESDQMAAAMRAGLIRGVSIGFVPTKWAFSTDKNRPFGIDFFEIRLLEISMCSVPCCPPCIVLGAVGSKSTSPTDAKAADRRRDARLLTARARSRIAAIDDEPAPTRDQRMAEARNLRRIAMEISR